MLGVEVHRDTTTGSGDKGILGRLLRVGNGTVARLDVVRHHPVVVNGALVVVHAIGLNDRGPQLVTRRGGLVTEAVTRIATRNLQAPDGLCVADARSHMRIASLVTAVRTHDLGIDLLGVGPAILLEIFLEGLVRLERHFRGGIHVLERLVPSGVRVGLVEIPRHVHRTEKLFHDLGVILAIAGSLDALAVHGKTAVRALGDAREAHLEPMVARQQHVGAFSGGVMPQVDFHPEVKLVHGLPCLAGVVLVHEGARVVGATHDGIRIAGQNCLPQAMRLTPLVVPASKRELVATDHGRVLHEGRLIGLVDGARCRHGIVGISGIIECPPRQPDTIAEESVSRATVTRGAIQVAGHMRKHHDRTNGLEVVAVLVHSQRDVNTAVVVAALRVEVRCPYEASLLDLLGINASNLGSPLRSLVGQHLGILLPNGFALDRGTVLERDLVFAIQVGIDLGERGRLRQPALPGSALLDPLAVLHGGIGGNRVAFPLGGLNIKVAQGIVARLASSGTHGVVHHKLLIGAALNEVALLEKLGLHVDNAGVVKHPAARRLHVVDYQEGAVGPALHVQLVHETMVHDDLGPSKGDGLVGTRADVKPVVSFLADAGHTRVDDDEGVGILRGVHDVAARVIVVGVLDVSAPLNVDTGLLGRSHPVGAVHVGHGGGKETRTLADGRSQVAVGGAQNNLQGSIAAHCPHAARAVHGQKRRTAILILNLGELLGAQGHGLVPRNAHPTGILALGVRTLHGIAQTVRVVARLN